MSQSLKILYCTDQLYKHGGVERVTTTKLNAWVEYTNNVIHLVTTEQKTNPFCYDLDERVQSHDLEVNYHRAISYSSFVNIKKTLLYMFRLRKLIKLLKPDIVVCVNSGPVKLFLPYIAKNTITINEYHASRRNEFDSKNSQNRTLFKKIINKISDFTEKRFSKNIALNEGEAKYFCSKKVAVIPNPLPIPKFEEYIRENIVIAAGRIAPVKGYDMLINAWVQVNKKHPDWKLHIYGDGDIELQFKLQKQIENLGLDESIRFCGITKKLNQKLFKSSIHVLSSHEESFGMVILEAQSCGLPSVAFNCPTGPRNLIKNNKNGILVEPNDYLALGDKINYLIENPNVRIEMGLEAKKNSFMYENESIMIKWSELFNKLKN